MHRRRSLLTPLRQLVSGLACVSAGLGLCTGAWAGPTAGPWVEGYSFEAVVTAELEEVAGEAALASLPPDEVFQTVLGVRGTRFPAGADADEPAADAPAAGGTTPSVITEPATLALVGLSLIAAAWAPRRRRVTLPSPPQSPAEAPSS